MGSLLYDIFGVTLEKETDSFTSRAKEIFSESAHEP